MCTQTLWLTWGGTACTVAKGKVSITWLVMGELCNCSFDPRAYLAHDHGQLEAEKDNSVILSVVQQRVVILSKLLHWKLV